jgi:hypothetical protein
MKPINKKIDEHDLLIILSIFLHNKLRISTDTLMMEFTNSSESLAYVSKMLNLSIEECYGDCLEYYFDNFPN